MSVDPGSARGRLGGAVGRSCSEQPRAKLAKEASGPESGTQVLRALRPVLGYKLCRNGIPGGHSTGSPHVKNPLAVARAAHRCLLLKRFAGLIARPIRSTTVVVRRELLRGLDAHNPTSEEYTETNGSVLEEASLN